MQDRQSVLSEGAHAHPESLFDASAPLSVPQTSILDSEVPELAVPVVAEVVQATGVNNAPHQKESSPSSVTSTFSVGLLRRLLSKDQEQQALSKKRQALFESIGVEGASSGIGVPYRKGKEPDSAESRAPAAQDAEAGGASAGPSGSFYPVMAPARPNFTYSNSSEQSFVSNDVQQQQQQMAIMQNRLANMAGHRIGQAEAPDVSSARVSPLGNVSFPIPATELAKRARPEYSRVLTVAVADANGSMFVIPEGMELPAGYHKIEMSTQDAISRGLIHDLQLPNAQRPRTAEDDMVVSDSDDAPTILTQDKLVGLLPAVKRLRAWTAKELKSKDLDTRVQVDNNMIFRFMYNHHETFGKYPEKEEMLLILAKFPHCIPWFCRIFPWFCLFTEDDIEAAKDVSGASVKEEDEFNFLQGSAVAFLNIVKEVESELGDDLDSVDYERQRCLLLFYEEMFKSANDKWKAYVQAMQTYPTSKKSWEKLQASMREAKKIEQDLAAVFKGLDRQNRAPTTNLALVKAREHGHANPHLERVNALAKRYSSALPGERIEIEQEYKDAYRKFIKFYEEEDAAYAQASANISVARKTMKAKAADSSRLVTELEQLWRKLNDVNTELEKYEEEHQDDVRDELKDQLKELDAKMRVVEFSGDEVVTPGDSSDRTTDEQKRQLVQDRANLQEALDRVEKLQAERTSISARMGDISQEIYMYEFARQHLEQGTRNDRTVMNTYADKRRKQGPSRIPPNPSNSSARAEPSTSDDSYVKNLRHWVDLYKSKEGEWESIEVQAKKLVEESSARKAKLENECKEKVQEYEKSAIELIKRLGGKGKTAAELRAWDEYKKGLLCPSETTDEFDLELAKLNEELTKKRVRFKELELEKRKKLEQLQPNVVELWKQYNEVESVNAAAPIIGFSDPHNMIPAAQQELVSQLSTLSGGKLRSFDEVERLDREEKEATEEREQVIHDSKQLIKEQKLIEYRKLELVKIYKESALQLYNKVRQARQTDPVTDGSDSGPPSKNEEETITKAISWQCNAVAVRAQFEQAAMLHERDYEQMKNPNAHKKSHDLVIQKRGLCRADKTNYLNNIRCNLRNLKNPGKLDEQFWEQILKTLASGDQTKVDKLREKWENIFKAKEIFNSASPANMVHTDLSATKNYARRDYHETEVKGSTSESPELGYTEADRIRDLDIMRHRQYDIHIQEMQHFAVRGSRRALHFCKLIADYVNKFVAETKGGGQKVAVVNDMFTRSTDSATSSHPSTDEFMIKWTAVDAYMPADGAARLGDELKYVLMQWASLPLERRAGSLPDEEEVNKILSSGLVARGADGSEAVKDPITKELMVVTTTDADATKTKSAKADGAEYLYPLGGIKRTPVSWLSISRDAQEVHVPIDDQLFVVRKLPNDDSYALHLTHDETLASFEGAAATDVPGGALYEMREKWWLSDRASGPRYRDIKADELTDAMWEAVLLSRQKRSTLNTVYTQFQEELTRKKQHLRSVLRATEEGDQPSITRMAAMSTKEYAKIFDVDTSNIDKQSKRSRIENLMAYPEVLSKVGAIQQSIAALEKAMFKIKFHIASTYGLPISRIGMDHVLPNKVDEALSRYSSVQTIATVGMDDELADHAEGVDGLLFANTWIDTPVFFHKVATFFNSFLRQFYPWERDVNTDTNDLAYMKQCIEWMLELKQKRYTYVEIQLTHDTSGVGGVGVRCWFVAADPKAMMVHAFGPGMNIDRQEDYLAKEQKLQTFRELFTNGSIRGLYAPAWRAKRRPDAFVGFGPMPAVNDRELLVDDTAEVFDAIASSMHAAYKVMKQQDKPSTVLQQLEAERVLRAKWKKSTYASELGGFGLLDETRCREANVRLVRDQVNSAALGASSMGMHDLKSMVNPMVDVMIPRIGMEPSRIQFQIQDLASIDPTDLNAILIAMGEKYSGRFATAIKTVESEGPVWQRVGTIVRVGQPYGEDIDEATVVAIDSQNRMLYAPEFEEWLENTTQFQQLANQSGNQSDSDGSSDDAESSSNEESDEESNEESGEESGEEPYDESDGEPYDESDGEPYDEPYDESNEMSVDDGSHDAESTSGQESDGESDGESYEESYEMSVDDGSHNAESTSGQESDVKAPDVADLALLADADTYIQAIENRHAPAVETAKMRAIMSMYDPGPVRPPISRAGVLIRPVPLPDIELEVA